MGFALASGWYRFRVDYMGYQFWCDALEVPNTLSYTMSIPHRDTVITVNTFYTGGMAPLEGVKAYLFTESGSYRNLNATTNAQGQVTFSVPDQGYKVRVDYLGGQYWSEAFQWQDREVVIDEGMVDLHVTWNGVEVSGVPVYLFTDTGTYLNRSVNTGAQGHAQFQVPVRAYKFRVDYNGHQYWTGVITPIAHQPLAVEMPLEQLALMPTNDPNPTRYDGEAPILRREPIKVASLGSLVGILSQTLVAQVAQPKVYYYITDHLGTPQKVVDSAGVVVWSGDYRSFGEVSSGVSTVQNAFRFPGQYLDNETSLHYNYHRYYQPRTGRYGTPDPIGLTGGMNFYSYAEADPLNFVDRFGLTRVRIYLSLGTMWVDPEMPGRGPYIMQITSGKDESMNKAGCAPNKNTGPIPPGSYSADIAQLSDPTKIRDLYNFLRYGDWGDWNVPLIPSENTETFGRDSFFLHGGLIPGSAGCVDFGGGVFGNTSTDQLLRDFLADPDKTVPVDVHR